MKGATKEIEGGDGQFFDGIAERYDLLNRILSLGMDGRWRRKAVAALELEEGDTILDVATGTADLALTIAEKNPKVSVVGIDPSKEMLAIGREKAEDKGVGTQVELAMGDGQDLGFDDNRFDGAVVSFGIRNFPDRLQGLREMTRVVRPGAPVVILELSEPGGGVMGSLSKIYVHGMVPRIGAMLSGSKEYRYLQESIAAFPPPEAFCSLMEEAGLEEVSATPLTFGAVHLFVGRKPGRASA